jgi:hypothetical protein
MLLIHIKLRRTKSNFRLFGEKKGCVETHPNPNREIIWPGTPPETGKTEPTGAQFAGACRQRL